MIAEADFNHDQRVTYEAFLDMWRQEIEDKKLKAWRGISKQRTVSALAAEMLAGSTDDENSDAEDDEDDFSNPYSNRLVSIAEIEERSRSLSSMKLS